MHDRLCDILSHFWSIILSEFIVSVPDILYIRGGNCPSTHECYKSNLLNVIKEDMMDRDKRSIERSGDIAIKQIQVFLLENEKRVKSDKQIVKLSPATENSEVK